MPTPEKYLETFLSTSSYIIDNQKLKISYFDLHFIRQFGAKANGRAVEGDWMNQNSNTIFSAHRPTKLRMVREKLFYRLMKFSI